MSLGKKILIFVASAVFPIVGIILGLVLWTEKYSEQRSVGKWAFGIGVISFVINSIFMFLLILASAFSNDYHDHYKPSYYDHHYNYTTKSEPSYPAYSTPAYPKDYFYNTEPAYPTVVPEQRYRTNDVYIEKSQNNAGGISVQRGQKGEVKILPYYQGVNEPQIQLLPYDGQEPEIQILPYRGN